MKKNVGRRRGAKKKKLLCAGCSRFEEASEGGLVSRGFIC